MKTAVESICCRERTEILNKIKDDEECDHQCIILHPGFEQGCTNPYALEIAYIQYMQQYHRIPDRDAISQAS
jgi:hypothetical protein